MFFNVPQYERPMDTFEAEFIKPNSSDSPFDEVIKQSEEKLAKLNHEKELLKLNQEFELLKERQFKVRRGRNNRIFYKSMNKTTFDYDT